MNTGLISSRYAKALYETGSSKGVEDSLYRKAIEIVHLYKKSDDLKITLQHPLLSSGQKMEIFLSKIETSKLPVLLSFISIIFNNKREDLLLYIFLKYIDLYRKEKNIFAGKLITATEIDLATETKLVNVIEQNVHGKLEMDIQIQPAIIGGFILEVDNLRWDASISGQLRSLRKNFTEQNRKTI